MNAQFCELSRRMAWRHAAAAVFCWLGLLSSLPAHAGSLQCSVSAAPPVSFTKSITYGGTARSVTYIKPASQDCPAPVYLLLTYLGATPGSMISVANAQRLTQEYGALVIAPSMENGIWNDNPPLAGVNISSTDDVGFLAAVLDDAVATEGADPGRVVVSGLSDGALMAADFACVHPEKLLGAVMVGATELQTVHLACQPSRPTSIVTVLGTLDDLSPYLGDGLNASAPGLQLQWQTSNGCTSGKTTSTALPVTVEDGTSVILTRNGDCSNHTLVELYTVVNGGHAWPGTSPSTIDRTLFGITSGNLDATITPWRDLLGY